MVEVRLEFDLAAEQTLVRLAFRASSRDGQIRPLVLDGEDIELLEVSLNGVALTAQDYQLDEQGLKDLIEFQIENGTNGIVPCGTTGESATISGTYPAILP